MKEILPDIIESMEDACEKRYDEMYVDVDHYMCDCGRITYNDEMNFIYDNPYSIPCCGYCFEEYLRKGKDER
jgi:hypothetical protein